MQIDVKYLENLRVEARFDDYKVISDQPIRYKGDGTAPGPYDYFLASSAMCAAYFVKVYCNARNIPTDEITIKQNNIVSPENRYKQDIHIQISLPDSISEKDKKGILASIDRCTVKRVIQNSPEFKIEAINSNETNSDFGFGLDLSPGETRIPSKDASLESTLARMGGILKDLGIAIEIASWRNPLPHVWSVHIRDADSPLCYTNGKGKNQQAALCSALGEYIERIGNNYFYNDYYLGTDIAKETFVHYPFEKWFAHPKDSSLPQDLMDEHMLAIYNPDGELNSRHLADANSGQEDKGICALPYIRQSDKQTVYIPVNLIGNLFVSNGMSAGNTLYEARTQALSEIFERSVKNDIIANEICLPDIPTKIIKRYPHIQEGLDQLAAKGFQVFVKDASLGGKFPVVCVAILSPKTQAAFASFGCHPNFEVALERALTELLQGRSFEGLNEMPAPTFNSLAVSEHNNIIDHFIDSSGVLSWKFFSTKADHNFCEWNFNGSTQEEFDYLLGIAHSLDKEVYILDLDDLGANACRILIPGFSEIYHPSDLIWDNNNRALAFRKDILNLHKLNAQQLQGLIEKLQDWELDDYMPIGELIGVAFEETSPWGELIVVELKLFCSLALDELEQAKAYVEQICAFSDHSPARKNFFKLLNNLLEIELGGLQLEDYTDSLSRVYSRELLEATIKCLNKEDIFWGLTPTDMNLKGIEKHQKLLESYYKLHKKRGLQK